MVMGGLDTQRIKKNPIWVWLASLFVPSWPKRKPSVKNLKTEIPLPSFAEVVNALTNHERNLWARAGYPGGYRKELAALAPYALPALRRIELRRRGGRGEIEADDDWLCENGHTMEVVPKGERCRICGKTKREKH